MVKHELLAPFNGASHHSFPKQTYNPELIRLPFLSRPVATILPKCLPDRSRFERNDGPCTYRQIPRHVHRVHPSDDGRAELQVPRD
jgi:hypothetical protein